MDTASQKYKSGCAAKKEQSGEPKAAPGGCASAKGRCLKYKHRF
jgi:hypothetical protein